MNQTILFSNVYNDFTDFKTRIFDRFTVPVANLVISEEKIYDLLLDEYATDNINYLITGHFDRRLRRKLEDVLPKYNNIWKIQTDAYVKSMTLEKMLESGLTREEIKTYKQVESMTNVKDHDETREQVFKDTPQFVNSADPYQNGKTNETNAIDETDTTNRNNDIDDSLTLTEKSGMIYEKVQRFITSQVTYNFDEFVKEFARLFITIY